MSDPLLRQMALLPAAEPDRARAARVRARCHARLAESARAGRLEAVHDAGMRLWRPLVAILVGVYFTEVLHLALQVYGVVGIR